MKKIRIAPFFTMLVVSCGTVLPSQSESSLDSRVSSLSILTTSNETSIFSSASESSNQNQTSSSETPSSNNTSSSSTTTNSSTPSTSEEPVSNRKIPFNQIGSMVAQIVDAKAMGIVNSKDRILQNGRRNAQGEDQNYMVKVTETYNPNTQITENQTIQVTFTRVTNTQTTELQTGTSTHVATADPVTIERVTDLPGNVVITNLIGHEFRLLSGETVVQDWISSEQETIEFIFDEALTDIVIESRSLNASISFTTFEDFTYTIKQGDQVIYEDLLDNDQADLNEAVGAITISGLTEGLAYDVTYSGYQVIETITQDEVDGQVDKLYVLYQYTFVSFVPLSLNPRPQDQDLELDYDDIPLYDKTGFYSDSARQSFVVDNNTGLIYKIEGINIASLSGGCVAVQGNPFPFDIRITERGELEFYSLHQNASINTYSCFKDIYENKFIFNDKVDMYDNVKKVIYYTGNLPGNSYSFFPTDTGLAVRINQMQGTLPPSIISVASIDGTFRTINQLDSFKIHNDFNTVAGGRYTYFRVNAGILLGYSFTINVNFYFQNQAQIVIYDSGNNSYFRFTYSADNGGVDFSFFHKYNLILFYQNNNIYYLNNIIGNIISTITSLNPNNGSSSRISYYDNSSKLLAYLDPYINRGGWLSVKSCLFFTNTINLLNSVLIEGNKIVQYSLEGNVYYDLIPEFNDGDWITKLYVSGTYVAPPLTLITLQPINR